MSQITSVTTKTDAAAPNPVAAAPTDALANESTFLRLLVSQLQNQDPLNPTDSTQFVSQLTAYSQLEQLIGINKNTTPVAPPATGTSNPTNTTTTPTV
jgi:flagellar basal-body rod modification protein FlgD